MARQELHSVNFPVGVKKWSATLPTQTGRTHFNRNDLFAVAHKAGNYPVNWEAGRVWIAGFSPLNIVGLFVQLVICKFGKRIAQAAEVTSFGNL